MRAARDALAPGVTELEVYGEMVAALAKAGGENTAITQPVLFGTRRTRRTRSRPGACCGRASP